jgi:hypothetical protein
MQGTLFFFALMLLIIFNAQVSRELEKKYPKQYKALRKLPYSKQWMYRGLNLKDNSIKQKILYLKIATVSAVILAVIEIWQILFSS